MWNIDRKEGGELLESGIIREMKNVCQDCVWSYPYTYPSISLQSLLVIVDQKQIKLVSNSKTNETLNS